MINGEPAMLQMINGSKSAGTTPVILLAHNEANLMATFLDHYRTICEPHFVVVDDHSTDGTGDILAAERDVTLFRPRQGASYAANKHSWRQQLLDQYAQGRWAITPDADEFLVCPQAESRPFAKYLDQLDEEGAEGVLTVMVDMYADLPLREHRFPRDGCLTPLAAFPYFDGQSRAPDGYHFRYSRKLCKEMPAPLLSVHGGMRDRLFRLRGRKISLLQRALINAVASLDGPVTPRGVRFLLHSSLRPLFRSFFRGALDMHKIGIIKWRAGLSYASAHRLKSRLTLSESVAAFLHFKFTRGVEGLEYIAERGQHAHSSKHYRRMLEDARVLQESPRFEGSRRFINSASLAGIIRDTAPTR